MKNIHFSSKYESYMNDYRDSILKSMKDLKFYFESFLETADLEGLSLFFNIIKLKKIKVTKFISKNELLDCIQKLCHQDKNLPIIKYLHQQNLFDLKSNKGFELLKSAIIYNAEGNALFFLSKKTPTSINENQITALHLSIINDNPTIIKELKKDKNLFKPSVNGVLPLHVAWAIEDLQGNKKPNIKKELIQRKCNEFQIKRSYYKDAYKVNKAKTLGSDLIFDHMLTRGQIINLLSINENNLLYLGANNYFKAIFTIKDNPEYFIEAKNSFIQYLNLENVKGEIDKDNFLTSAYGAYSHLKEIYNILTSFNDLSLINEAENIVSRIEHPLLKAMFYNDLSNNCRDKCRPLEALNNIELAHKWISKIIESGKYTTNMEKIYHLILINRIHYTKRFDSKKALKYIKEAEKILPPDNLQQELLENKILIYQSSQNYKKTLELVKQIHDPELREIWENYIKIKLSLNVESLIDKEYFNKHSARRVEDFSSLTKFQLYFHTLMMYKVKLGKHDEAIKTCKDLLPTVHRAKLEFNIILQALDLYKLQGNWTEGYEFLKDSYNKYPMPTKEQAPFELFYFEYFFLENNGHFEDANLKIRKLIQTAKNSNLAYHLAYTSLEQVIMNNANQLCFEKIEEKFHLFNELLKNCPGNNFKSVEKIKLLKKLVDKLRANNEINNNVNLNPEEYENKKEFYSTIDLLKLSKKELNEAWPYLTPSIIHKYFQQKKQALASLSMANIKETNNLIFSWEVSKEEIYFSTQENIYNFKEEDPNSYFYIPEKIFRKLDPIEEKQFKLQINKGLVTKNYSMNGLKIIKVPGTKEIALIEAKIDSDKRIYATKAFENAEGKIIYVFNKVGNHEKVANAALKPLEIFPVSSLIYENKQLNNEGIFNNDFDEGNLIHVPLYEDDVSILGDNIF